MRDLKILIIDDDKRIRSLLERYLGEQGFIVDSVADGEQMKSKLEYAHYDLLILDWMLPGESGLSLCQNLKAKASSPTIIMLTANGSENDRISGLEAGADDYLPKPFNPRELIARIHAVLRRKPLISPTSLNQKKSIKFGPYRLDGIKRSLYQNEHLVTLTSTEFSLLNLLANHLGIPMTREKISLLLQGKNYSAEDRWLDIQVSRLRRILEQDPSNPTYLQTIRGVGYILVDDDTPVN